MKMIIYNTLLLGLRPNFYWKNLRCFHTSCKLHSTTTSSTIEKKYKEINPLSSYLGDRSTREGHFNSILTAIGWQIDQRDSNNRVALDDTTQHIIEYMCNQPYRSTFTTQGGINTAVINSITGKYFKENIPILLELIGRYRNYVSQEGPLPKNKGKPIYYSDLLINFIESDIILNIMFYQFMRILSYVSTDDEQNISELINISTSIGNSIVKEYIGSEYRKHLELNNKEKGDKSTLLYRDFKEILQNKDPVFYENIHSSVVTVSLGTQIVDIMIAAGMLDKYLSEKFDHKQWFVKVVNTELIEYSNKEASYPPVKLPMIVEPKPYKSDHRGRGYNGGYLDNETWYSDELFIDKVGYKVPTTVSLDNKIIRMVNGLNSTPFKINSTLLSLLTGKFSYLLTSPISTPPNTKKLAKRLINSIKSHNSIHRLENTILDIANVFNNITIYFPNRLDQRGRLYCEPQYFNYQSTKLAKALLLFDNPGIINKNDVEQVKYLKMLGANYYGLDKVSNTRKIEWVDKNLFNIINYENGILLNNAEEKFLFLAFCIEYERYISFINDDSKDLFYTYLPIQLDATCNGFQHIALLAKETGLLGELNLVNDSDQRNDFYTYIIYQLGKWLEEQIEVVDQDKQENKEFISSCKRLIEFNIHRKLIKNSIMTIPYNSSINTRVQSIKDKLTFVEWDSENEVSWYKSKDNNNDVKINTKDIMLLTSRCEKIIYNDNVRVNNLIKYLNTIANICNNANIPIIVNSPSGLKIIQHYLESSTEKITPFHKSKIKINLKVFTDKLDRKRQKRALIPNLIHMLDGASLCLLYNEFCNIYKTPQFYSVHDCFATTFDKIDILKKLLCSVYTDLYLNDSFIEKFDKEIFEYFGNIENISIDGRTVKVITSKKNTRIKQTRKFDVPNITSDNLEQVKLSSQHILV